MNVTAYTGQALETGRGEYRPALLRFRSSSATLLAHGIYMCGHELEKAKIAKAFEKGLLAWRVALDACASGRIFRLA